MPPTALYLCAPLTHDRAPPLHRDDAFLTPVRGEQLVYLAETELEDVATAQLPAGVYRWPFSFRVPHSARPSFRVRGSGFCAGAAHVLSDGVATLE